MAKFAYCGCMHRKQLLLDWLEVELPNYFVGRLLPVDTHTADRWGRLMASAGRPLPAIDSLLAATALQHDLTLVTRNTKDFEGLGVQLVNPLVDLLRSRDAGLERRPTRWPTRTSAPWCCCTS